MHPFSSFSYDEPIQEELERALSKERLSTYVTLSGDDKAAALRLHAWNIAISEALYGPIQVFEIVLRNAIHNRLIAAFGDRWYDLCPFNNAEKDMLQQAKNNLADRGKSVSAPHVIASLSFGFWLSLLRSWHEIDLWRPHLYYAFPFSPKPLRRKQLYGPIHEVRMLRNRIAHHEPIIERPGACVDLEQEHTLIIQLTTWISPIAAQWIRHHSRFDQVWENRPS